MAKMCELARTEVINRAKAMTPEQRGLVIGTISTSLLVDALNRRDEVCTAILNAVQDVMSNIPYDAELPEKQHAIRELKAILGAKI